MEDIVHFVLHVTKEIVNSVSASILLVILSFFFGYKLFKEALKNGGGNDSSSFRTLCTSISLFALGIGLFFNIVALLKQHK